MNHLARNTDPATSHAAAATVHHFANGHHEVILTLLRSHPGGLTVHEMAKLCDIDAHAIGKRMKELETAGQAHVLRTGSDLVEVTRPGPSGRQARVWGVWQ